MFVSLVEKYGLVPKDAMIETKISSQTYPLNKIINTKLRQYTAKAREIGNVCQLASLKNKP